MNWEGTEITGQSLTACLDVIWLIEVQPFILSGLDYSCLSYIHSDSNLSDSGFHK